MEDKKNDTIFKNISWDDLGNMDKQQKYDRAYLRMALEWAKLSHCKRKKEGA